MAHRRGAAACERARQNSDDVLRAARAVVAADGIAGLSMAAVAAEAGVAVGSLYRHFPAKTDLVTELLRSTCDHELAVLRTIAAGDEPPAERLATAVSVFVSRALSSGRVAYAMICEPTVAEAELLRRRIRGEMATILAGIIRDGMSTPDGAGGSAGPHEQDPLLVGLAVVGAVSEVLTAPDEFAVRGRRAEIVEALTALALRSAGLQAVAV